MFPPDPVLDRPVFALGGREHTLRDAVGHARATGAWTGVEATTRTGLAHQGRPHPASADERHAAGVAFRRRRRLLAADDLRAWLNWWGLSVGDWRAALERALLRAHHADDRTGADRDDVLDDGERTRAVWADAVCTGAVEAAIAALAAELAVRAAAAEADPELADDAQGAQRWLRDRALGGGAVARYVEDRRLEWLRLDVTEVRLPSADAVGEALLCHRVDGMDPGQIAQAAGSVAHRRLLVVDEVAPSQRATLLGAAIGEAAGLVADDGPSLVVVHVKLPPVETDEDVRARAERLLLAAAVQRHVEDRISWLEGWHARP